MSEEVTDEVGETARIDEKRSVAEECGLGSPDLMMLSPWMRSVARPNNPDRASEPGLHAAEHESGHQYQQQ